MYSPIDQGFVAPGFIVSRKSREEFDGQEKTLKQSIVIMFVNGREFQKTCVRENNG
jgi:hypothetical protein